MHIIFTYNFLKGSKGYKSAFNGQVKDDEIYGEGNTYSAQYWEYDARLGRRWNLDPKPNPSLSWYSTFANNSLLYSDPLGDTLKVKFGFLRSQTAVYNEQDKKFYDKKGNEINTDNRFYNKVNESISTLNSKANGALLISELAKSEHVVNIRRGGFLAPPGMGNKYRNNGGYFARGKANAGVAMGGTLIIQMSTNEQMYTDIAHEGGHAWAGIKGFLNFNYWMTGRMVDNNETGGRKLETYDCQDHEKIAMYWENMVKFEHGIQMRQSYYIDYDGSIGGPAFTKDNPYTSTFLGKNIIEETIKNMRSFYGLPTNDSN